MNSNIEAQVARKMRVTANQIKIEAEDFSPKLLAQMTRLAFFVADDSFVFRLNTKKEVCPCCDGRGIVCDILDGAGFSREDFEADPDFAERYLAGDFGKTCPRCAGQNVVDDWRNCKNDSALVDLLDSVEYFLYENEISNTNDGGRGGY